MSPNLVLVLRVRNKQVIEFVEKPLHFVWYFGVINIGGFYICMCLGEVGERKHDMILKLFSFESKIYVVCISKSLVMSSIPPKCIKVESFIDMPVI